MSEKIYNTYGIEKEVTHIPGAAGCFAPKFWIKLPVSEKTFEELKLKGYEYKIISIKRA